MTENKLAQREGVRLGRPLGLTPDVHRRLVSLFESDASIKSVSAAAKVSYSTLKRWLQKGAAGHPDYEAFYLDVEAKRALHKKEWVENLENIAREGGAPGVRATMALLRVIDPEEWGDRDTIAIEEHQAKKTAEQRLAELPPEQQQRARELIKLLNAENSDDG